MSDCICTVKPGPGPTDEEKFKMETGDRPPLAKHDIKLLDLAFAMDCTGSMGEYIDSARDNIIKIVEDIVASEKGNVRLALVEYRDHPPEDDTFVTRVHDFTPSPSTMKQWLSGCSADGGGDAPEAVADALHDVLKLSWRDEATKICVLVSDAPPHGLSTHWGDSFPNGCPAGIDPMRVSNQMAEKGITLYVAGCEPSLRPYKDFFMAIAYKTGGQYVPLTKANLLARIIVGGAQEEMSLEQFMAEVDEEVQAEVAAGREINEDELSKMVHEKMKVKGIKTKQLYMNKSELKTAADSPLARKFANMSCMADVRKDYKESGLAESDFGGGPMLACCPPAPRMMMMSCPMPACPPPSGALASPPLMEDIDSPIFLPEMAEAQQEVEDSPGGDTYETVEQEISYAQASRMVQKSMARNLAKKS